MGKKIFFEKLKTHQKATPLSDPEAPLRVMLPPQHGEMLSGCWELKWGRRMLPGG